MLRYDTNKWRVVQIFRLRDRSNAPIGALDEHGKQGPNNKAKKQANHRCSDGARRRWRGGNGRAVRHLCVTRLEGRQNLDLLTP